MTTEFRFVQVNANPNTVCCKKTHAHFLSTARGAYTSLPYSSPNYVLAWETRIPFRYFKLNLVIYANFEVKHSPSTPTLDLEEAKRHLGFLASVSYLKPASLYKTCLYLRVIL